MTEQRDDLADDQVAAWVARMDSDSWSAADETALVTWLSADHRREGELLRMQAAWLSLDAANREREGHDLPAATPDLPARASGIQSWIGRRRLMMGGAGALAASLVGGLAWLGTASNYSTALGEIRKVPLADGSSATINSASEIDVRLDRQRREVRLAKGEAWFQVAKDASRPFVVEAGAIVVQAIGTAFSVRRRENGADILVTEGVVEGWAAQADGHRIRLTAGQQAFIADNAAIRLVSRDTLDVDRTLAWRAGSIDLKGRTLADAIEEFNRYNPRKLVLEDQTLAAEQFDGIFRTDDPEGFAMAIHRSFGTPMNDQNPRVIRIGEPKTGNQSINWSDKINSDHWKDVSIERL